MRTSIAALVVLVLAAGAAAEDATSPEPRIGLVLSGGGARGIAHVGVLKVLEELRVPVHVVTGTSMGSIVGALYAAGYSPDEMEEVIRTTDWPEAFEDKTRRADLSFRRKEDDLGFLTSAKLGIKDGSIGIPAGFIQGQNLNLLLRRLLVRTTHVDDFDDLHVPFRCVSTNLVDGSEVVHASGDLATAVRASMSIPGAFQPVELDGKLLVDGMLVNNIPIGLAFEQGADIVIAVDVGSGLLGREDLTSALAVADQVLSIATTRMADQQRALLRPQDFLIQPDLTGFGTADFERGGEIVPTGERAARAVADRLAALSVSEDQWAAHLAQQRHGRTEVPVVDRVEFSNDSKIRDEVIVSRLEDQEGRPLDLEQLEEDLAEIYGLEIFERVDYVVETAGGETVLRVEAREKSWGTQYVRVGLNLEENFDDTSTYNLAVNYTLNPLNDLGGEWRTELQIGDTFRAFTEIWQPIDHDSRWFVAPSVTFVRERFPVFEGDDRVGEFALQRTELGFDAGRQLGNFGEFRAGIRWQDGSTENIVGADAFRGGDVDGGGYFLRLAIDTLDDSFFPGEGLFGGVTFAGLRDALGSDADSEILEASLVAACSWGRQSFLLSAEGVTQFGREIDGLTRIGGFLNLSGLDRDQQAGRHAGLLRAATYRRVADLGVLNYRFPLYVGASLELGNAWEERSDIAIDTTILAGSVFLGWRTPLGPLYIAYGLAEGGRSSPYIFLGRTF